MGKVMPMYLHTAPEIIPLWYIELQGEGMWWRVGGGGGGGEVRSVGGGIGEERSMRGGSMTGDIGGGIYGRGM